MQLCPWTPRLARRAWTCWKRHTLPHDVIRTHPWPVFSDRPTLTLHPCVENVLLGGTQRSQCTAFQLVTGPAFHVTYSQRFRKGADDATKCPTCLDDDWTPEHYFDDRCDRDWEEKGLLIPHMTFRDLLTSHSGGHHLSHILRRTGASSRPLPKPRPDPP
jgi:hypothetical protein